MKIKKSRPVFAFLIFLVMSGVVVFAIMAINLVELSGNTAFRNGLKAQNAIQMLEILENGMTKDSEISKKNVKAGVNLTITGLKTFAYGNSYNGPRTTESGVVVQVKDDEILYPEGFQYRFTNLSPKLLEDGLDLSPAVIFSESDENEKKDVFLTSENIAGNFWYIDWMDYENYLFINQENYLHISMIEDLQKSFRGLLFLFEEHDGSDDLDVFYAPGTYADVHHLSDLGETKEIFDSKPNLLRIGKENYSAYYDSLRFLGTDVKALILINTVSEFTQIGYNVFVTVGLIFTIITVLIFGLYWVQTYVRSHDLTEEQKRSYHPAHIRKITRIYGLICTIVVFISAIAFDSLGNLSREAAANNESLKLMISRMEEQEDIISRHQETVETWYTFFAQELCGNLTEYPQLRTDKFLMDVNELLGSEYIIFFDEKGKEVLSSNGFIDLDLQTDLTKSGGEFKRLLQGAPNVILEPENDFVDLEKRQLIGASARFPNKKQYGAVVIAIDPEKTWEGSGKKDYTTFLNLISPAGSMSFVVDTETGSVLFSSSEEFQDKKASDIGLYKAGAPGTELDTFKIRFEGQNIQNTYGAYQQDNDYQFYYLTLEEIVQKNTLPFGLASAFGFLLIYWVISTFMLHPYRARDYNESVKISNSTQLYSILDQSINTEWIRLQNDDEDDSRGKIRGQWRNLPPEKKTGVFIQIMLMLMIINIGINVMQKNPAANRSAFDFILQGTWTRGINLLSFAGIVFLILAFVVFFLFKNLLVTVLRNILDRKSETIARLILSLIQYAAVIALLFFAFDFLGFDTRTLLASVSVLSLAVTLGSKDLVADILSGIFIIFEDDFHVGDIIDVGGFSGIVQEIGVRSTKIIGIGDNIKIVGNQSVKNVLNMSKLNSWFGINLKVPADQPIKEIEEMLEKELPAIGESVPEIISGPFYKGIMEIGAANTLYIIAECKQWDYRKVQREMNHALLTLFSEHGIPLL